MCTLDYYSRRGAEKQEEPGLSFLFPEVLVGLRDTTEIRTVTRFVLLTVVPNPLTTPTPPVLVKSPLFDSLRPEDVSAKTFSFVYFVVPILSLGNRSQNPLVHTLQTNPALGSRPR